MSRARRYRVVERVVFEYVFLVEAESPMEARQRCRRMGDGEAVEQNEGAREFLSTLPVKAVR